MSDTEPQKSDIAQKEEQILEFWQKQQIFEKSLTKQAPKGEYVFYDGPPFATGTPHYGHILASTIKDAIPRYQTMKGFKVDRKWGWDCHGLPIEHLVEKDLGISGKKQIEALGVEKFNEHARSKVLSYVSIWKKTVDRMGRWVDFDGSYKTMDNSYIESVWWALKEMHGKDFIYESTKVLPYCPRCETPIANSEIAMDNSYKDITDISVYAQFKLLDKKLSPDNEDVLIIAWTTTPWTLPGNFALAVSAESTYVKIKFQGKEISEGVADNRTYIFAKDRLEALKVSIIKNEFTIVGEMKGSELVGSSYQPLFSYFEEKLSHDARREKVWKIYAGEFVTMESGTGIVHLAPYGEDDVKLFNTEGIPFITHVTSEGKFKAEVTDFAGIAVKPKDDHQSGDILIIKYLAHNGLLFAKEKLIHSYPHCFRCETPLYYTAIPAWFINIQKVKPRLLELNEGNKEQQGIHWVPDHLKLGRFQKSMEGAPDWNISRNRFWATPLPFFKNQKTGALKVLGSLDDITSHTSRGNTFIFMRHGQGENNVLNVYNCTNDTPRNLTEEGKQQAVTSAKKLITEKYTIDAIYASPIIRTQDTAHIVAREIGFDESKIITDNRIIEEEFGDFNNRPVSERWEYFKSHDFSLSTKNPNGESLSDVRKRIGDFMYDIDSQYENKTILIVTHDSGVWMSQVVVQGLDEAKALALKEMHRNVFVDTAGFVVQKFVQIPHNADYELDFHRPYIDNILLRDTDGNALVRTPEVIDCWFESGSMMYAAKHFPFENKQEFLHNFPAQFVAEYIAQTRTWFYYMHAVSTILFDTIPFENVVTTGNVLAEDGQKMSKSKNNFPDPWIVFNKYGVDALRFYLLSSPIMRSEDLYFSEKGVDEVYKKNIMRIHNVLSFYELYKHEENSSFATPSKHVLDQWIISRLSEVITQTTQAVDGYEIDRGMKPITDFIDDLSTWYLRRSRDRFKSDDQTTKQEALHTLKFILKEFAKLVAPFTPFIAEFIFKSVKTENDSESVHLESWPTPHAIQVELIDNMTSVRNLVSIGLEIRMKAGTKVRQPLASASIGIKELSTKPELLELIKEELNVKEVMYKDSLGETVEIDTTLTQDLKEEGIVRDIMRAVQEMRKKKGLNVQDRAKLLVAGSSEVEGFLKTYHDLISKTCQLDEIKFVSEDAITESEKLVIDTITVHLSLY